MRLKLKTEVIKREVEALIRCSRESMSSAARTNGGLWDPPGLHTAVKKLEILWPARDQIQERVVCWKGRLQKACGVIMSTL